jgi:hypothetical protein
MQLVIYDQSVVLVMLHSTLNEERCQNITEVSFAGRMKAAGSQMMCWRHTVSTQECVYLVCLQCLSRGGGDISQNSYRHEWHIISEILDRFFGKNLLPSGN